jgi:hypothetical protein
MKKAAFLVLAVTFLACTVPAQSDANLLPCGPQKNIHYDITTGTFSSGSGSGRHGGLIWANFPTTGWYSATPGFPYLDWAVLNPPPTGLPDEVIDGFTFTYATNNQDPAGEDIFLYFTDSCTGWGNYGVQESAFAFKGLPNAATFGTLPAGQAWTVTLTTDLEGTGYEFLLGSDYGQIMSFMSTPATGATGFVLGSPGGGSENVIWGPGGPLYFPAPGWGTFARELFGQQAPAANTTYGGFNARGNDASLYTIGNWTAGSSVDFVLRKNGMPLPGWLLASLNTVAKYFPQPLDVTLFLQQPVAATIPMWPDAFGDFDRHTMLVSPSLAGLRIYFQGAITAFGPIVPVDLSNGVMSN